MRSEFIEHNPQQIVIIGGGHAGIEAAKASINQGVGPTLITTNIETLGSMSCNPAIGGVAKSHVVKELDALSGLMPKVADLSTIQLRTLNESKGAAVQSTRAQCDKRFYNQQMIKEVMSLGINIIQGNVEKIEVLKTDEKKITLETGEVIVCRAVVLTTGTFLNGLMHVGSKKMIGGRFSENASTLTKSLNELGIETVRLKTGTPPRILKSSIDFSGLKNQESNKNLGFHWNQDLPKLKHTCCYFTFTNELTHEIIENAKERSPIFNGQISSAGPRYCPSIEDKINRFRDKTRHHIFLEPEGLNSVEYYPNGISTSLPIDVQYDFVRTIPGLEKAIFTRPGYAVEYDAIKAKQLNSALELKQIPGFFTAGQINGSSGYEEAGGQGYVAGFNAALYVNDLGYLTLSRTDSYIGVMIDDLIRWDLEEPYRLFTCRAESRLSLREDNAYDRMGHIAEEYNLWSDDQKRWFENVNENQKQMKDFGSTHFVKESSKKFSIIDLIKQNRVSDERLLNFKSDYINKFSQWSDFSWERLKILERYEGYIDREKIHWNKIQKSSNIKFPKNFDFQEITGLSNEMKTRLKSESPKSIRDLMNIDGINPSAVFTCYNSVRKFNRAKSNQDEHA